MTFDVSLWGAFFAGLLSFLSPCILPLVPPYLCFLAGASLDELTRGEEAAVSLRRALPRALAFVIGFATVFVILGASASMVGKLLADQVGWMTRVAGLVIIAFGLHFLRVLRIPILYREARVQVEARPAGLAGAYLVGLAFAFGWTPCVGPVLASILFVAGAEDTAARGAVLLGAYAAGIGGPFLLAAAFLPTFLRLLKRARHWIGRVEKVMGAVLVAMGVLILTGSMPAVGAWLLETFPALGRVG